MGNMRISEVPAGCHWENWCDSKEYAGCHTTSKESMFNTIVEPSQTNPKIFGGRGGVCVKGSLSMS